MARRKPHMVERGILRKKYGFFGKLVKRKPKKTKPWSYERIAKEANEAAAAGNAGLKANRMRLTLRSKNERLVAVKKEIKEHRTALKNAINEIAAIAKAAKARPKRIETLRQATRRLKQLKRTIGLEKRMLERKLEKEQKLIQELRAGSREKKALEKQAQQLDRMQI